MLFTATQRQDAQWFLRIATAGYAPHDGSAAFFPLYPLAVRLVGWIPGVGPLGAALIVGNAAFFGALVMLHALTRLELGSDAARRTVLFCAFFPSAFFLLAPYTEPLFLLLSVSAFWFARRNRWVWSAVAGAGAAMTRNVGVLLIVALAVEAVRQWRQGRLLLPRLTAAACVALGPLLYFGYWQVRFQDFWAPLDAQRNWQRDSTFPLEALWHAVRLAWREQTWWLLDLTIVVIAIAGITIAAFRVPLTYSIYAGLSVLIPLTFTFDPRPLTSMPRFMAVVFPVSWGFAIAAERRRPPEAAILVGFAAGFGILAILFVNWQFVF
jgi:Mannosyltransferase (PIG-V)